MNAVRASFSQGQSVLIRRQALFVQSMAGFVNAAPGHVAKISFVNPCCNAYILRRKGSAERVFALVLSAPFEIKLQFFYKMHAPGPLLFFREILKKKAIIYLRCCSKFFEKL